jgi:hypothetical protein
MSVRGQRALKVLQYNVHTSDKVLMELLADERVRRMDVLAIQEPWRNSRGNNRGYNPSGGPFRLISTNTEKTRAVIYLNRNLQECEVLKVDNDIVSISITTLWGGARRQVIVHSAYSKPPESHSTRHIPEQLGMIIQTVEHWRDQEQLLTGDFNLHHPSWGGQDSRRHRLATDLIVRTGGCGLRQLLEPGTITRDLIKNAGLPTETRECTTIDLTFCSEDLSRRVVSCKVRMDLEKGSDHLPIVTTIILQEDTQQKKSPTRAWKRLDRTRFDQIYQSETADLDRWDLNTTARINEYTERLVKGAQVAIEASTPWARHSPRDKQYWTPECTEWVLKASNLRWKARNTGNQEDRKLAQIATAIKGKVLRAAKRQAFREAMAQAPQGKNRLWKTVKWATKSARNQLEQEYFPTLKVEGISAT